MAAYSVNTSPARERAVQWAARKRGVTADQVVQALLNEAIDTLVRERRDLVGSNMLDAYDAQTPETKVAVRSALGWTEP